MEGSIYKKGSVISEMMMAPDSKDHQNNKNTLPTPTNNVAGAVFVTPRLSKGDINIKDEMKNRYQGAGTETMPSPNPGSVVSKSPKISLKSKKSNQSYVKKQSLLNAMESMKEDALHNIQQVKDLSVEKEHLESFRREVENNFLISSKEQQSHSKQMGNLLDRLNLLERRYQE